MSKKINYQSRNFADTRSELINFVRQYYPNVLSDFNDSSVGSMLIDLNAAVSDMLSFNTDRVFQETQIDYAKERSSILSIARTFGLNIPNKRPSITLVDFSVKIPVNGDSFDISYCPIIKKGCQISGGGKVFETTDDIDFSNPFTTGGLPNRLIVPNVDSNNNLINYTLTKRELVLNGTTKVFKKIITANDSKPFLELVLPDNDIISVENIISLEGTSFSSIPSNSEFGGFNNNWFEMGSLAEDKIFIENNLNYSDNSGVKSGNWVRVTKKFIKEFTNNGFLKITFGSGNEDISSLNNFDIQPYLLNSVDNFVNTFSLGEIPKPNYTMFIKYRVGGGSNSNLGPNTLNSINLADVTINGSNSEVNLAVKKSLNVNNPIPALGGKDAPSIDEVRNLVKYNYSAQHRAVTIKDYETIISLMDGKFGVPFRRNVHEEQNKIIVSVLCLNQNNKLTSLLTSTLKDNISEFLSDYRMLNDYVEVRNGRVINISFEVDLFIDKSFVKNQIISDVINKISSYLDINNQQMGVNIYFSQLLELINNVSGVLNVIDLRVYNQVGKGTYSLNKTSQPYVDETTKQINLLGEYTLYGESDTMFEILNPNKDIKIRVK